MQDAKGVEKAIDFAAREAGEVAADGRRAARRRPLAAHHAAVVLFDVFDDHQHQQKHQILATIESMHS